MKTCTKCQKNKSFNLFAKKRSSKDGLQTICKSCQKLFREKYKFLGKNNSISLIVCIKCKQQKHASNFHKAPTRTGFSSYCKLCTKEYYQANNYKKHSANRRRKRIEWLHSLKNKPCVDCGKKYDPICMDFDHVKLNKINSISRMVLENVPKIKILDEIKKCDLVCVLCHNIRTHQRLKTKYPTRKYNKYSERNIKIINKLKDVPCSVCGEKRELCNMQYDHTDPDIKIMNISKMKKFKVDTLLSEINKCQVICSLCHRRKSIVEQRFGFYPKKRQIQKKFIDLKNKRTECTKCKLILYFDDFPSSKRAKLGISSWCKKCTNEYKKLKRLAAKDHKIQEILKEMAELNDT